MIRKLIVLGLIVAGFGAGVYVGVSLMRPRPVGPPASSARVPSPAAPSSGSARSATPAAPPPAARPAPRPASPRPDRGAEPVSPAAPAPTAALLNIDTDVPGAQVFVDRQFIGASPIKGHEVAAGTHRINVSAPGFDGVVETIDAQPGSRDVVIKLREVRLDAAIDVIHKHRIGSCKGRLVATPQGLRFDTTDKDDRFASPLVDLETLEVDYLKKNLKVRIRNGRTFDFTDPGGNADNLFVFHRDVEKARARLQKGDPPASTR